MNLLFCTQILRAIVMEQQKTLVLINFQVCMHDKQCMLALIVNLSCSIMLSSYLYNTVRFTKQLTLLHAHAVARLSAQVSVC